MSKIPERNYLIHPHYIIISLLLASITALFLGFSAAYVYTRIQKGVPPIELPNLFYFNSILLLISSFTLIQAKKAYQDDQTQSFKQYLWITLTLSLVFLIAQVFAWYQLMNQDIFIQYNNMASYLYVISGIHFAHVLGGIPFLGMFIWKAYKYMKHPPGVLVYFSDPAKLRSLRIITIYWHFLDILWIYLVLLFLVNYLVG